MRQTWLLGSTVANTLQHMLVCVVRTWYCLSIPSNTSWPFHNIIQYWYLKQLSQYVFYHYCQRGRQHIWSKSQKLWSSYVLGQNLVVILILAVALWFYLSKPAYLRTWTAVRLLVSASIIYIELGTNRKSFRILPNEQLTKQRQKLKRRRRRLHVPVLRESTNGLHGITWFHMSSFRGTCYWYYFSSFVCFC